MKLDERYSVSVLEKQLLVVDDHPLYRHGLARLLSEDGSFKVCGEAETAQTALESMRRLQPDGAIVDISLPGTNGIELIKLMLAEEPKLPILVVSMHDESVYALRALRAGARGYVMKDETLSQLVDALHRVMDGGIYVSPRFSERLVFKVIQSGDSDIGSPVENLSDRELEVLELLGHGRSTRQIAGSLHLSVKTIETHRAHIKEKLRCRDAEEMVSFATEWVEARESGFESWDDRHEEER
jgi:DNA-binding NarL/FixJ family response regulator